MATEGQLVDYLKRVAADLHDTRQRLHEVEERYREPVAVVGMACRFPGGVGSPEELWGLVAAGRDVISGFPVDRGWDLEALYHPDPDHPGTSYVREGGFIEGADLFDAAFFGINPREALDANPQQRLLLETAWELLERAGVQPTSLKGTPTGVYVGTATTGDGARGEGVTEGYAGNAPSVLSGRVAYTLGLEGPALTVETACSSSLVATHLAVHALRQGDCTLALAGGVTVMSTPEVFTGFSRQRGLSPDGRCKAFAASADGTGFAEGVGLLLLERLSDARRNGHRVLAVIRGSAVNQDGASNGLSAPNGPSQERVIRAALAGAGLAASEVDAVEAHGTGTRLGDPIEAQALLATYGQGRAEERPLWLGSVKSNIGHTQAAAGVAGVIKMVMAMRHGTLPASLHIDEPSQYVDWETSGLRLLSEARPWPEVGRPRRAGVSSFGFSGTNAHLIVEESPEPEPEPESEPGRGPAESAGVVPWVVSARSEEALRAQAQRLSEHVAARAELSPVEVGWSLVRSRSVFEHRAVVVGNDPGPGLAALASGQVHPDVVAGVVGECGPGPVLVFPGQGSQWVGMGAELLGQSAVFAARMAECEQALAPHVDWSLSEVIGGDGSELARVDVVQPVLWAIMVSLAAVWADHGVVPAAVIGHSQGEIAAACVAGALSLEDAARVVAVRSKALRQLSGGGAMASIGAGADQVQTLLNTTAQDVARDAAPDMGRDAAPDAVRDAAPDAAPDTVRDTAQDAVQVAAVNSPSATVISGPPEQIQQVVTAAQEQGLRARVIDVDYASHGPQVDQITDHLTHALADITPTPTDTAFYSTVTGQRIDTTALDTAYWVTNLRRPVRFADTLTALLHDGYRVFIEASPHPVLTPPIQECADRADLRVTAAPTLRRDHGDLTQITRAAATVFTAGTSVDWTRWFPSDPAPTLVDLPTYPFQRKRFWPTGWLKAADPTGLGLSAAGHPLLGAAVELAEGDAFLLTGRLAASAGSWLSDHVVSGTPVLAGAVLVEWALRAADGVGCASIDDLTLRAPLPLPESGGVRVQVAVGAADADGRREVQIYSRPDGGAAGEWECHASGTLAPHPVSGEVPPEAWPPPGAEPLDAERLYERAAAAGYGYGPAFRGVRAVWRDGNDLLAEVELPEAAGGEDGFGIHPALLDAALHPALLADHSGGANGGASGGGDGSEGDGSDGGARVWLPFDWSGVSLHAVGARSVRVRLSPGEEQDEGRRVLRLLVSDPAGAPVLAVDALWLRQVDGRRFRAAVAGGAPSGLFTLDWTPLAAAGTAAGTATDTAAEGVVVLGSEPAGAGVVDAALRTGPPSSSVLLAEVGATGTEENAAEQGRAAVARVLEAAQAWLAEPRLTDVTLAFVTRGGLAGAGVEGLVRSAQAEHPDRFVLVDADADSGADAVADAVRRAVDAGEGQVRLRDGRVLVPRLVRVTGSGGDAGSAVPLAEDDTVVVTGGTGMLGGLVAEHLVRRHGARRLLLLSRQGERAPGAAELRERLGGLGAHVGVRSVDVADGEALAEALASIPDGRPPAAVVHAAGALDDAVLTSQTAESLERVWRPKALGAWNLHALTRDVPLKFFWVFSSAAGVIGNAGQAGYAAANAFCDALMARRADAGRPGMAVAWGLWAEASGMTAHLRRGDRARLRGMRPLSAEHGLALLDAARRSGKANVVAADVDVADVTAGELPPALRGLAGRVRRRAASGGGAPALAARLAGLDAAARSEALSGIVREHVAAALGHASPDEVREEAKFEELGFDSLTAVELRNRLAAATGLRLPATLVFDHPTPRALARHLGMRLDGVKAPAVPARAAARTDDPIAIVSMACRYPGGVKSPEDLWELVASGRDAIGGFPSDRGWDLERLFAPDPGRAGTSRTREGGFLYEAGEFDAAFFGISPREALAADPQQRLLLETAWETIERAGIAPTSLAGTPTGVFTGVMYHDYASGAADGDPKLEGYVMPGVGSAVPGRVAYTLGLEGPAVTVDTACSSSLVAVHLAADALRRGECDLALAGGVAVMATPGLFVGFSRQGGLAPDGRCKSFAAAADGTGWGEGVGLLLLERLSDARRNGHRVLAVVRGSAVNQDGASNGFTAPNGPSQERVIAAALASAGLTTADVDTVEAHGTGTTLGDPIEAQALLATYGQGRAPERPLWLGSIKSNIGHTQAAAGVAGVIKMVMAMRHGTLPASLHIDEPSPHVDWSSGEVRLLTEPVPWTGDDRPRRAGVSSFGASGTNAHVIIEEAGGAASGDEAGPAGTGPVERRPAGAVPWVVSARSRAALEAQAALLAGVEGEPVDVGWSLLRSRASFEHRAVAVGSAREELAAELAAAAGTPVEPVAGEQVWLFSGQGSQRVGMGAGLYERFPLFAAAFDEVCDLLDPYLERPLKQVAFSGPAEVLDHTAYAQAALFAVQVGLARLLGSMGLRPDAVVGHSIGEIAAAHVAGVLDVENAARLVGARASLMGRLPAGGAMVAVQAGIDEVAVPEGVSVAALNTPDSTVLSGPADLVDRVAAGWRERGRKTRRLRVSHAFHSALMDPMLEEFADAIGGLPFAAPSIPLISNVTGEAADARIAGPEYWVRQVREPVRFHPAVARLADRTGVFLELGPDPVLATAVQHTVDDARALAVLDRKRPDATALGQALGRLHAGGIDVDWSPWFPTDPPPRLVDLPTYPFQRRKHWLAAARGGTGDATGLGLDPAGHPLLGAAMRLADGDTHVLTGRLPAADGGGWLTEHRVLDTALLPGTALVECALRAAGEAGCSGVEELTLRAPLVLAASGGLPIQVVVSPPEADGRRPMRLFSRPGDQWVCHAEGVLAPEPSGTAEALGGQWPPANAEPLPVDGFYERVAAAGYAYGPAFQGMRAVWRDGADLLAEVVLPEEAGEPGGFALHPALLDAALHPALLAGGPGGPGGEGAYLPFIWSGVSLWAREARSVRVRLTPVEPDGLRVTVTDAAGAPVLGVERLVLRPADPAQFRSPSRGVDGLFEVAWTPAREPAASAPVPADEPLVAEVGTADEALRRVRERLAGAGPGDERPLVIVTRGAVGERPDPDAAAVWGLVRCAQLENPERFVLLDVAEGADVATAVAAALGAGEPQAAVRDGGVLVPRLVRAGAPRELAGPAGARAWRLTAENTSTLEDVSAEACPEVLEPLRAGQVRIEVRAAGINFRDVLIALGMVPGFGGIGGEGAGVVVEVGPGVAGVAPGDSVMGLFGGAFGPLTVADARAIVPVPDGWDFRDAAGVAVAFLTAWYGLVDLAGLRPGESVLVHAATGGVGRAAVQIARHLGAHVYATASPAKHALLEEMGIDEAHRASSRDLDFEDRIRSATGGRGVDVVLNSLAGEFTDASLRLLAEGGRFLEMGKTDVREDPGVWYRAFDLVTDAAPDRIASMLAELRELFVSGRLRPLPVQAWPLGRAREALRHMSQARHTGKLVLDVPAAIDPGGTVLITGGTGALGPLVAEHLVRNWGVRHLTLVGRRGPGAPGAAELADRLDAEVTVVAADVGDPDAVRDLVAGIDPAHPLTGVVHAAGIVDDGLVTALTPERMAEVWRVKAGGAAHLHAATADLRLGLFVVFSSLAATSGSPGQAAYAAANAYCDALMARRRAAGLPGLSIGWGLWEPAGGMTGGLTGTDLRRMRTGGMSPLGAEQGLALLDGALEHGTAHLVAADLDVAGRPADTLPPLLRSLAPDAGTAHRAAANGHRKVDWAGQLAGLSPEDQQAMLLGLVRTHAASVLGHADPDALRADTQMKDLGFDSLTAVELRNRLSAATGLRLPAALAFTYPSPAAIAGHLRERLVPAQADPSAPVLGEVDRLEALIDRFGPDGPTRGRLAKRLEALLWRLSDSGADGTAVDDGALESASDDEMFELIDRELGSAMGSED
ncbi:type I polyketide synthase [Actinomadura fibrosa]|uniref:Type I polyketide synthase n=1 Tax=Actinomadura fibrosa TaxID=111802 RepID=A0ABW2XYR0_9ACTN|nr:type I polyketide synthase [Actinomadura fibrosa]